MFELLKKSILAGIGAVVLTTERVQEATKRFVEEGKMSTDEAEKLADDLLRSGERQWDEVSSRMQEAMRKWVQNMDLVQRKDYLEMRARLEMLEQRVALLEEGQRRQSGVVGGY
jgi:polyhydroxyalkanoate synthesis regulator phasin